MTEQTVTAEEREWWRRLGPDLQHRLVAAHISGRQVDVDGHGGLLILPQPLVDDYLAEHGTAPDHVPYDWITNPFIEPSYPDRDTTEDDHDD